MRLEAIESVYRERLPAFVRVATAIVGDRELARDAGHDGFVRAVLYRRRFRGGGSPEAWLWRIVVNEARKRGAREARATPVDPSDLRVEHAVDNGRPSDELSALIAALPERQRLTLFLRHYADLDYAAIAHALSVSQGTVGATLNAAHKALREQLEEVDRCLT